MSAPANSNISVSGSQHSSNDDQGNLFKLRIELFAFERATMEAQLANYIERIQRKHPSFLPEDYKMLPHHDVIQFHLQGELSSVPAFEFYEVQIQLVQQVRPSRVYFTAALM